MHMGSGSLKTPWSRVGANFVNNEGIHVDDLGLRYFKKQRFKILGLSTYLLTKSKIVYRQIADFVYRLLRNKSNMIWNFVKCPHLHSSV